MGRDDANLQGDAGHLALIHGDVDGIRAVPGEGELLEIEDEIAGGEEEVLGQLDVEGRLHGGDDGMAILVDKKDADFVEAFLLLAKEDAEGDGALRVNGREGTSDDGIKCAEEAEFSVVIDCGIAEGGDLDFHEERVREARGICNGRRGGNYEL